MTHTLLPGISIALLGISLIAFAPVVIKLISANVATIGIARLLIAIAAIAVWLVLKRERLSLNWQQLSRLLVIGVAFGLHWLTFFISIKESTASLAAIGLSTYGIFLLSLGWYFLGTRPQLIHWGAIGLACVGVLCVTPHFSLESQHTRGFLIGILSGFCYAFLPILHQRNQNIPLTLRTLGQFAFALPIFLVLLPQTNWQLPITDWAWLVFLGLVSTTLGHGLWVKATTLLPTTLIGGLFYAGVPCSMLLSVIMLDEQMTPGMLIGASLIILSNLIVIWKSKTR